MTDDRDASPWNADKLNRRRDGEHVKKLLRDRYEERVQSERVSSYILNIDAPWGEGKTFFLRALRDDLVSAGHLVAYVNAWQDDLSSDPLMTVMAAINDAVEPHIKKGSPAARAYTAAKSKLGVVAVEAGKQVGIHTLKALTGLSIGRLLEAAAEADVAHLEPDPSSEASAEVAEKALEKAADRLVEERLSAHERSQRSISQFKAQLAKTLAELETKQNIPLPLFVFVDELDRCRPLYAISLLEEMKHLFEISGVVFVVATDSDQLSHSIKAVYGEGFDSRKYLRRFFDRTFLFPEPDRRAFIEHLFENRGLRISNMFTPYERIQPIGILESWSRHFGLSQRDLIQCVDIIATARTSWPYGLKFESIRFLSLVWAIFTGRLDIADAIDRTANSETAPEISRWVLIEQRLDRESGEHIPFQHNALNAIQSFNGIARQGLMNSIQSSNNWKDFFVEEYHEIWNGKAMPDYELNTVALQYRPLIASAGHYVDDRL